MSRMAVAIYCLIVLAVSWSIQYAAVGVVGDLEKPEAAPWLLATMWSPTLVALLFLLVHKASRQGLAWRPTWRSIPVSVVAVAVPTMIAFGVVAVFLATGWGAPGWFAFATDSVTVSGGPWMLGLGEQGWAMFAANVALTGAAFAVMNCVASVGEEFAWRGFLQHHMIDRFGLVGGIVLLGLFWSFWHLPALLAGYNFPEYPALGGFVLFPITLVAVSFFMAWLTIRSGSFWPAAIAHGAGNSIEQGVVSNIVFEVPRLWLDLTSLAVTVLFGLLFLALLVRRRAV